MIVLQFKCPHCQFVSLGMVAAQEQAGNGRRITGYCPFCRKTSTYTVAREEVMNDVRDGNSNGTDSEVHT